MGTVNAVFLIGNGFDRNLGLKTSYLQFYEYYISQDSSDNEAIRKLKKSIEINKEAWSDLELSLGKYSENIKSQDELDDAIFHLIKHLRMYLQKIEEETDHSIFSSKKLLNDLVNPERVLSPKDQQKINIFKSKLSGNDTVQIQILTFNYTKVLEKILENKFENFVIDKIGSQTIKLKGIEHIHGYVNDRLILGVNDSNQITNKELRENQECVELLAKPEHNQQLGHLKDNYCLQQIANASMIYVFGSSIGETDKLWWEAVGKRLGIHCCLVIYYLGEDTDANEMIKEVRRGRRIIDLFLSLTSLDEQQKSLAKKSIYVSTTKDFFKLVEST
jgi:hypothetical protein